MVSESNTLVNCLNMDALKLLSKKDSPAMTWADLNPEWPGDTIALYGPGTGTFDYFVETILGEADIREDCTPSEEDNVLVGGVANDPSALGYFGHSDFEENQGLLSAVAIDNGAGCVEPTAETVRDGSYAPLSRPLCVCVKNDSLQRPEVREFMRFYLEQAPTLAGEVGFVASPEEAYAKDAEELDAAISGDVAAAATPAS